MLWLIGESGRGHILRFSVFSSGTINFLFILSLHCHISKGHTLSAFIILSPRNNMSLRLQPLFVLAFKPFSISTWCSKPPRPRSVLSILPLSIDLSLSEDNFVCASSKTRTAIYFFPIEYPKISFLLALFIYRLVKAGEALLEFGMCFSP